jgi:hypothetical protein
VNESWKRRPRRNGDKATYVNVPRQFIDALGIPWKEFWNTALFEFKIEDGKAIIELRR